VAVKVLIPTPLRRFTNDQASAMVDASTVGEAIAALNAQFPGIQDRICEPDGRIRRFVNVFVNGSDVRSLSGARTGVKDGDEIGIIPAMAGGQ
jgi:molybdopterin synthase sulfur carrier subunit